MTLLHSALLGLIEGICEFLPVSSTAHLIVAQKLLGQRAVDEAFTVIIQMGAIGALMWRLKDELIVLTGEFFRAVSTPKKIIRTKLSIITIASIPTLILGFFLKDNISLLHGNLTLIAVMSIGIGGVLAYAESVAKNHNGSTIGPKDVLRMGVWQILALIPGTSRSGITTASALFAGVDRKSALEWSFYLSMPTLLIATLYEMAKTISTHSVRALFAPHILIGTLIAYVSAYYSIPLLRRIVAQHGFLPFVFYRILFGVAVLLFFR